MATYSIFLPGKSHGQRGLASYSPWGYKRVRHNLGTKTKFNLQETPYIIFPKE